jgi:hypothetical protein
VGRYPFGVELFHLLLHAGLSRRFHKIEHRLFSHISMNWRGRPLTSHEVIVETIGATTTRAGLSVHAELDEATYPKGVKIPDQEMKALQASGGQIQPVEAFDSTSSVNNSEGFFQL